MRRAEKKRLSEDHLNKIGMKLKDSSRAVLTALTLALIPVSTKLSPY